MISYQILGVKGLTLYLSPRSFKIVEENYVIELSVQLDSIICGELVTVLYAIQASF